MIRGSRNVLFYGNSKQRNQKAHVKIPNCQVISLYIRCKQCVNLCHTSDKATNATSKLLTFLEKIYFFNSLSVYTKNLDSLSHTFYTYSIKFKYIFCFSIDFAHMYVYVTHVCHRQQTLNVYSQDSFPIIIISKSLCY